MERCFKTNQKSVRGTSNLLVERMESIVVFKVDVFFVWLKEEIPNKSVSEILESRLLRTISWMLQMLLKKIYVSSWKIGQWRR